MDFSLSKKEILFQQMIRAFAEKEVKPLAAEVDEEERFPVETVEKMARVCATTGVIVSAHTSLCASPIYEFGNEEQRKKYLPKLCSGEWIGAFGLTEPNAGTDASAQQTMAVAEEDHYVLNGSKIFITNEWDPGIRNL